MKVPTTGKRILETILGMNSAPRVTGKSEGTMEAKADKAKEAAATQKKKKKKMSSAGGATTAPTKILTEEPVNQVGRLPDLQKI